MSSILKDKAKDHKGFKVPMKRKFFRHNNYKNITFEIHNSKITIKIVDFTHGQS